MTNFVSIAAWALIIASAASPVLAQDHPLGRSVGRFDKNSDGKVSAAEWVADKPSQFKKIDANKDGSLTAQEATIYFQKLAPGDPKTQSRVDGILATDANTDGKVTLEELAAAATADFKTRDHDGDGYITTQDKK